MSVEFASLSDDYELSPSPSTDGGRQPSPATSPDLNNDPFLSFTGTSLLDGLGCSLTSGHVLLTPAPSLDNLSGKPTALCISIVTDTDPVTRTAKVTVERT